jgi:hypothetical protein
MKAKKNFLGTEITEKEETNNFLDRHNSYWFIDTEANELRIGKSFSDFLNKKTENFQVKTIHLCDIPYWKLAETVDGKFVLLNRNKLLK